MQNALRRTLSCLLVAVLLAGQAINVFPQTGPAAKTVGLTKQEREFLVNYFKETRKKLLDEIFDLSDAQMKFKPQFDKWSIEQISEHLAAVENVIYTTVTERVMKSPAMPERRGENGPVMKDFTIVMAMTNRANRRFQAPDSIQPFGKLNGKTEIINSFEKSRGRTIAYLETTNDDLRSHFREGGFGLMDGYQWLVLLAAHTERHLAQLLEIKSHSDFPKK